MATGHVRRVRAWKGHSVCGVPLYHGDVREFANSIVADLRQRRYQAYLVGGCVRDLLLGREPADYDVATDATPDEVMRIFPDTYAVGAQFGVVLVPAPKDELRPEHDSPTEIANEESSLGHHH